MNTQSINAQTMPPYLEPVPGEQPPVRVHQDVILPDTPNPGEEVFDTALAAESRNSGGYARWLRITGAVILVASASSFLFRNWDVGSGLLRYGLLLVETLLLTGGAYYCGVTLGESKGSRTLLALVSGLTTILFAALGGFVLSSFFPGMVPADVPGIVSWTTSSGWTTAGLLLVTLLTAVPLNYFAFKVSARPFAGWLTLAFLVGNSLLLLPFRGDVAVFIIVAVGFAMLTFLELRIFQSHSAMSTFEGRVARLLLAVPILIVLGRSLWLYSPSDLLFGMIYMMIAVGLQTEVVRKLENPVARGFMEFTAGILALGAMFYWLRSFWVWSSFEFMVCFFCAAGYMAAARLGRGSGVYRAFAGTFTIVGIAWGFAALDGEAFTLFLTLPAGLLIWFGYREKSITLTAAGIIAAIILAAVNLLDLFLFAGLFNWVLLSLLGLGLIVGASVLERRRKQWVLRVKHAIHVIKQWQVV